MNKRILTVNGGSSSIKVAVFELSGNTLTRTASITLTRIGLPEEELRWKQPVDAPATKTAVPQMDLMRSSEFLCAKILEQYKAADIAVVGHRIVHGGSKHWLPELITNDLIESLTLLTPYDPLHMPASLKLVAGFQSALPGIPQMACFDTGFCHSLPPEAQVLPVANQFQIEGIRRYGFHGLSCTHLMDRLRVMAPQSAVGSVVLAHLGSGCSLTAVKAGQPIETTMAFTPNSGIPMGTRCGDIDAGLYPYLSKTFSKTISELDVLLTTQSGLLGISGSSSDMRDLLQRESVDPRAALAVSTFCYQVRKAIGALAAAMGGLDAVVFTGGIGESSGEIRKRICSGLEFLGIALEPAANSANHELISTEAALVRVFAIPADEEIVIAEGCLKQTQ